MAVQARRQLISLQRSLYEKAYKDAHALAAGTSRTLMAYSNRFEQSLPDDFTRIEINHLTQEIKDSTIALYGDFHTLKQSQRGLVRILRAMKESYPKKPLSLALEAFRAADQKYLDAYQRGTLPEETFLKKTEYHTRWGFPWAHFKMLFEFASENSIHIFGINTENCGKDSLAKRDLFAAEKILTRNAKNSNEVVFCLIGEHHLADEHLPRTIRAEGKSTGQEPKTLRILSNIDKYFFNIPNDKPTLTTEYLHLKEGVFCVMNSPPWMKWQSFTIWEELRSIDEYQDFDDDAENESEFEQYTEQTYDVDYHFLSITKNLSEFIGEKINQNTLSKFSIYSNFYSDEINKINFGKSSEPSEVERMIERASLDGVYFVSDSNVILLNELSINNLSEASGQFIHKVLSGFTDTVGDGTEQFYRRIIKSAVGMVAAKMLNPKRKCLTMDQFDKYIKNNHRKRLSGHLKTKRDAFKEIIRYHQWMKSKVFDYGGKETLLPKTFHENDVKFNYEISRAVGLLLGFKLYSLVMSSRTSGKWINDLFLRDISSTTDAWHLIRELYQILHCPSTPSKNNLAKEYRKA